MRGNSYQPVIEPWKTALISRRARRRGFRSHEIDDVQQQVVLALTRFRFDPAKSNGASERTVLTALIDRQLSTLRRARDRRERHVDRECQLDGSTETNAPALPGGQDQAALVMDVRDALSHLPPEDRQMCAALADGQSIDEVARSLGCGWHTVRRRIDRIREYFQQIGLAAWIGG